MNDSASIPTWEPVHRRNVAYGFAASYGTMAVSVLASVLATPIYIRVLGAESYGLWLTIASWITYLSLSRGGLPQAAQNRTAEYYARGETRSAARVMATAAWLGLALSLVTASVLAVLVGVGAVSSRLVRGSTEIQTSIVTVLVIASAGYLIAVPGEQLRAGLRAVQHAFAAQMLAGVGMVVAPALGVATVLFGGRIVAFAWSQALASAGLGILSVVVFRRTLSPSMASETKFSSSEARRLVYPSMNFLIISLAGAMIWGTDNLVIAAKLGTSEVTRYAVSARLLTLVSSLISAGAIAILPTFTAWWARGELDRMRHLALQTIRLVVAGASATAVLASFFGRDFLLLWAGDVAVAPRGTFAVLIAIFVVRAFVQAFEMLVISISRHRLYAAMAVAEGLLNLGLSLLLVEHLGLLGVALGTLIAHVVCTGWFLPWSGSHALGLRFGDLIRVAIAPVLPSVVATALAAGLLKVVLTQSWITLIVSVALSVCIFLATYWQVCANEWEHNLGRRLGRSARDGFHKLRRRGHGDS